MPWQPLPRIAFAVAIYPFTASSPADLPLELGDELYIIEQGGKDAAWLRGYLVAPPSLLAGLTSVKGQTLEARVFSGIFPRSCVEVREVLGEGEDLESGVERLSLSTRTSSIPARPGSLQLRKNSGSRNGERPTKTPNGAHSTPDGNLDSVVRDTTKPAAPVPMLKIGDETPTSSEPLVDEIASCLREWHSTNLHELLLSRQYPQLDKMSNLVQTLDLSRRQILHNVLTDHEIQMLREKTVWDLVQGNKMLNGEVIVRDPEEKGRVLTGEDSVVELTKLQAMMSLLEERPQPPLNENLTLHHLMIDVKAFVGTSTESTSLELFLAAKGPGISAAAFTESYVVDAPAGGSLSNMAKTPQMRTLFTDLTSADIGEGTGADNELYLIVKVHSVQPVIQGRPPSRTGTAPVEGSGVSRGGEKLPSATSSTKPGRRSLMWGQKGGRAPLRNVSNSPKLDALPESGRKESRDEPPSTAGTTETKVTSRQQTVARTVGIGALKLNSIFKQDEEVEHIMMIWTRSAGFGDDQGEGWEEVIREIMDSKSSHFERSRKAERLQVHLKPFSSQNANNLIKETPTLLSGITKTSKMSFSGAPTQSRSDIYLTIDDAFLPRQALLTRGTGGAIPLTNVDGSNLQVILDVRRANGERIENCIFPASNAATGKSFWESMATERGESWGQTLRLAIPSKDVHGSHLVMHLADVPNSAFAICHMPLWDQEAFIRDGRHSLLLYKYDDSTSMPLPNGIGKGGYLGLPWSARGKDDISKDEAVTGPITALNVTTYLCSTKFSQDKVLLGLLKWKEHNSTANQELLKRLVFVPEIEIVKQLSDVFDAIFGILVENTGNDEYEDLIFSSLVTVLGIVHDRRFNLGPLVDQYAETKFNYPFATPCLVRSFTRLLDKPSDPDTSRRLRATFKVVRHIIKFITHARGQQKVKEEGLGIKSSSTSFVKQVRGIFKSLENLMRNTAPILVGSQTLAVQHFHTWLPELKGLLKTEEILHIAIDFMESCADVKGKLVLYKLILIINYCKLDLFSKPEQRSALSENTVRWIAPHWGKTDTINEQWKEQVRLCCSILSTQLRDLGTQIPDYIPKIIDSYLAISTAPPTSKTRLSLLFPTTYPFPSKTLPEAAEFDEALIELSAVLSALSTSPTGMQLELADHEMAALLEDILQVHLSILECEAFPANWLSVRIYHHKSTMITLEYLAGIMQENFLPEPDDAENYNTELWRLLFTTLLKLVGSESLALETFPEQKRRAVWKIAGDVRETGAELLRRTWEAIGWEPDLEEQEKYALTRIGGYQVQYVPGLVGPIIELCLSVHEGLRHVAVEVLQTMIVSEWTLSEDLSVIQTEMIECLDHIFKSRTLTESILQKLFINELLALFEPTIQDPEDPFQLSIRELIMTTDEFLDLLVAVHSTNISGEASHLIHRLRLMEFLRDMQKEEIFVRYVHQLAQLQADARNPTEAALALRLHADLYEWDPTRLVPALTDPEFPAQSQFERKERIYFDIIKYFEEGQAWSSALAIYNELQMQYQENVFDFSKLARTQRAIATIYETISKTEKLVPKYFRVVYKGMGFSTTLRDKEFVFEGSVNEKTTAFIDRIQEQHPSAQILTTGEVTDVEGQFLHISVLTPHKDLEHHVYQRARIPHIVRDYMLSSQPQLFSVTSKRNTTGPVHDHSAEKILCATAESFPTILRRSEIIAVTRAKLGPEQTALERIVRKTQEMSAVEKRLAEGEEDVILLLIEALNISVNPISDSSVSKYRELLPVPEVDEDGEVIEEVEMTPVENAIRIALIDHAIMIKRCLTLFSKFTDRDVLDTRTVLHQNFEVTYAPELASFAFPQAVAQTRITPTLPPSTSDTLQPSTLPHNMTNGTVSTTDTSILNTPKPQTKTEKNRLSFLKRSQPENALSNSDSNGSGTGLSISNSASNGTKSSRGRLLSNASSKSRAKDNSNRMSFTVSSSTFSFAPGKTRNTSVSLAPDNQVESKSRNTSIATGSQSRTGSIRGDDWVTNSEATTDDGRRRSSSSQRDSNFALESKIGSVKRRFSMLKMGKKKSSGNIVGSVAEE